MTQQTNPFLHLVAGAHRGDFEYILTQVACEAAYTIARANVETCRSAIAALEAGQGCSRLTKLRALRARVRKLERESKRGDK